MNIADNRKQTILLVIALALILLAGAFIFRTYRSMQPQMQTITQEDIEKEIQRIQNDPGMPPQAKQAAIENLRSRSGSTEGGR